MSKALLKAAAAGNNEQVKALLEAGAEVDFVAKGGGRTALIEATIAGYIDTVQVLIDAGAGLDRHDSAMGFTALCWAVYSNDLPVLERLLQAGASVELTGSDYAYTPLMVAALQGHAAGVAALLDAGADLHAHTSIGLNALSLAQARGHAEVVALLLAQGARPPAVPEEVYLPWPAVSSDLSEVDHSDPACVLRGFILAMHRWETDCHEHREQVGVQALDWTFVQASMAPVFERFCTPRQRPQGRGNSIGWPPDYTPGEALISVEVQGRRATLMTRQQQGGPMRHEALYTLVRTGGTWRLDVKKTRPWGTLGWDKDIL